MYKTRGMDGRPLGMVGMDLDLEHLIYRLEKRSIFDTGYLVVLDKLNIAAH